MLLQIFIVPDPVRMRIHVFVPRASIFEAQTANTALERLIAGMFTHVFDEIFSSREF